MPRYSAPYVADDRVVLLVHQLGPSLGFAPLHVPRAFGRDHLPGHAQPDPAVDRPAASGELSVVVLDGDLVAEEPRRAGAGVGDQRLGLRQLQREFVVQELTEATFDLLSFRSWSGEPEQDVIGVADVTQPPILRIVRIQTREAALLLAQRSHRGMIATLASTTDRGRDPVVLRIGFPAHTSGVFRHQNRLDKHVQPVQVDVGQARGENPALRRAAERGTPHPILQVPGSQHLADQPKQPVIVDLLAQRREHDLMVKLVEAAGDVALDKPGRSRPGVRHLAQRGVAPPAGPETVGAVGELRLVVRLQQQTHDFADQLVRPRRQSQRPLLPVLLGNVVAPDGLEPVALVTQRVDDALDLAHAHAVRGLRVGSRGHRSLVGVDAPVGQQIQLRVEQLPIQLIARQAAPAAFTEDLQDRFGVLHYAYLAALRCPVTCAPSPCGRLSRPPWWDATPTTTTSTPSPWGSRPED